jgi:hypothetical protein
MLRSSLQPLVRVAARRCHRLSTTVAAVPVQVHASADIVDPSVPKTLVILNYKFDRGMLFYFWGLSDVRVCADGAANRLYDLFSTDAERQRCDLSRHFVFCAQA